MSYQVLARKWRPRTFSELVGQESTVQTLSNALNSGRLHHAYLFTGTRGVGKTTLARILAKAFNCETSITATPCGTCSNCQAIDKGNFIDLIEIDAASRTKVEDTRELLDNVQFLPSRGRYKIYLIDEVHMLSRHSFNALLKTLEEPPEHSKFFLATTDPQKLPATILSRCLKFSLKKISVEQISAHLDALLGKEDIQGDTQATRLLAHYADGSLRDALSLLDQAIAHGAGSVSEKCVREMLGISGKGVLSGLLRHLLKKDAKEVLSYLRQIDEAGGDFPSLLEELLCLLHAISVEQVVPDTFSHPGIMDVDNIAELARQLTPEDTQLYYQFALKGKADIHYAPTPRAGMEMIMLRMLLFSNNPATNTANKMPSLTKPTQTKPATGQVTQTKPSNPAALSGNADITAETWPNLVQRMGLSGLTGQLANHCRFKAYTNHCMALEVAKTHAPLLSDDSRKNLLDALQKMLGEHVTLSILAEQGVTETPATLHKKKQTNALEQARQAFNEDPNVLTLKKKFDARVLNKTIKPTA